MRPSPRAGKLDTTLTKAVGVLVEEWGLSGFSGPPLRGSAHASLFPQIVNEQFALHSSAVSFADDLTEQTQLTQTNTRRWEYCFINDVAIATNEGLCIGIKDTGEDAPALLWESILFRFNAICENYGRILCGGFYDAWPRHIRNAIDSLDDLTPTTILWSSPRAQDFPSWFFLTDGFSEDALISGIRSNTFGWIDIPELGQVVKLVSLQNNVIAYGTKAVYQLRLTDNGYTAIPLLDFGVSSRLMVAGDLYTHLFQDKTGAFWTIGRTPSIPEPRRGQPIRPEQELGSFAPVPVKRLGYDKAIVEGEYIIKDLTREIFYVTGADSTLIISLYGASSANFSLTSMNGIEGEYSVVSDNSLDIELSAIDMNLPSEKTLTFVRLGGSGLSGLSVKVTSFLKGAETSKTVSTNFENASYINLVGTTFKVGVIGNFSTPDALNVVELDYITVGFQISDRRGRQHPDPRQNQQPA